MIAKGHAPSPTVSVVIPTYNGERWIQQAVKSALDQTHSPLEVLVVNDASTDRTASMVASIEDRRLRLLETGSRSGVCKARNLGGRESNGELLAFLDHDDLWFPTKLEKQISQLGSDGPVVAVGCLLRGDSLEGHRVTTFGVAPTEAWHQEAIARADLLPFEPSALLTPTSTLRDLGYFDEALTLVAFPDFLVRAAKVGRIVCVDEVLGIRRLHGESLTRRQPRQLIEETWFMRARVAARARGSDLSWEAYLAKHRPGLRARQKEYSKRYRYVAGIGWIERRWMRALRYAVLSSILDPIGVARAVARRLRGKRSPA